MRRGARVAMPVLLAGPVTVAGTRPTRPVRLTRGPHHVNQQGFIRNIVRQLEADVALDGLEAVDVLLASEADGMSRRAGACGPAAAVDVILRVERQIVVEHVRDALDVE